MGLTLYIFDSMRKMRKPVRQVIEFIHSEADGKMECEIPSWYKPKAGESIGMMCKDGRFRLFEITQAETIDRTGTAELVGRDAAWEELEATIVESAVIKNKTVKAAMQALLSGTGWSLGQTPGSGSVGEIADADFETVGSAMERIADTAEVDLRPYFVFTGKDITAKKIDILSRESKYRGRIVSKKNAADIVLTESGTPKTRVYPLGGYAAGESGDRKRITIGSVSWSASNGDPASKPAGQNFLIMPGTSGKPSHAYRFEDNSITDPGKLLEAAWKDLQKKAKPERSGTAKAGDLSFLDGYTHMAVEVNDLVTLQLRSGERLQERIANIKRRYVRRDETLLEFGKRQDRNWLTKKVEANERRTRSAGGAAAKVQQEVIDQGAELYRAAEDLKELSDGTAKQLNEVWIDLDAVKASLELKAQVTVTDALGDRITSAEIDIDGLNAEIQLKASTKDVEGLESSVSISLDAIREEIALKADQITLEGYVTASQLSTVKASISNLTSGMVTATVLKSVLFSGGNFDGETVTASMGKFTGMRFGENLLQKKTATISGTTINYVGWAT